MKHFASSSKLKTKDKGEEPFGVLLLHIYLLCTLSFRENNKACRGKLFENTVGQFSL